MKQVVNLPQKHGRLGDLDELYIRVDRFVKQNSQLLDDYAQLIANAILDGIEESETLIESSDN